MNAIYVCSATSAKASMWATAVAIKCMLPLHCLAIPDAFALLEFRA